MYLSIIEDKKRTFAYDREETHKGVCQMTGSSRKDGQVLFRVECGNPAKIYMQTLKQPHTVNGYRVRGCMDMNPMLNKLKEGDVYGFRIALCPCKRKNGKVIRWIHDHQERKEWIENLASKHGFEIIAGTLFDNGYENIAFSHGEQKTILSLYDFCGNLRITDLDKFLEAYCNGIGREKAYGSGMLLLRRPMRFE